MANRLAKLASTFATAKKSWDDIFLKNMPMMESDQSILGDPYSNVDLVFTCISTTARAIAQVPLTVVTYSPSGTTIPVKPSHPWQQLVNRPNYLMNRMLFIESIIGYWLTDGNVCIIPFPPGDKTPAALWPVRWRNMRYNVDGNGHLVNWVYSAGLPQEGVSETPVGQTITLSPDEVIHLRFWNPNSTVEGLAPSVAGRLPILGAYKAAKYNQNFFDNGAVPGGVLQTDQRLQKDTVDLVRSQFEQKHKGYEKAHKVAVLQQGLSYQAIGITQKDMDFVNLRKADRESIMQIYGMKKSIISVTESVNHATAIAERKEWWKGTCMPLMRMILDCFNTFLFHKGPESLIFDISNIEALHEDFNDKVKTCDTLLRLGFTRNEVNSRLELGFPEVEWGDMAYMPVNMMPVNVEGLGLFAPKEPAKDDPEDDKPGEPDEPGDDTPAGGTPNDNPDGDKGKLCDSPVGVVMTTRISSAIFDYRMETLRILSADGVDGAKILPHELFSNKTLAKIEPILSILINEEEDSAKFVLYSKEVKSRLDDFFLALKSQVCNALDEEGDPTKKVKSIFNKATKKANIVAEQEMQAAISFRRSKNG